MKKITINKKDINIIEQKRCLKKWGELTYNDSKKNVIKAINVNDILKNKGNK